MTTRDRCDHSVIVVALVVAACGPAPREGEGDPDKSCVAPEECGDDGVCADLDVNDRCSSSCSGGLLHRECRAGSRCLVDAGADPLQNLAPRHCKAAGSVGRDAACAESEDCEPGLACSFIPEIGSVCVQAPECLSDEDCAAGACHRRNCGEVSTCQAPALVGEECLVTGGFEAETCVQSVICAAGLECSDCSDVDTAQNCSCASPPPP